MLRSVRTFLPVSGDPAALIRAFEGDPGRWLPGARRAGPDSFALRLRALSITQAVTALVGSPWHAGATHWRTLSWKPVNEDGSTGATERFVPSWDGEVGLHVEANGRVTLIFDGRYRPPGGPVGTAVDVVALRRVAQGTMQRLASDIAARLSAEGTLVQDSHSWDTPAQDRSPTLRT